MEIPGATVLEFDHSVENHFRAMDTIAKLCKQEETEGSLDASEIERLSSTITFPREWQEYGIQPRAVRITSEVEGQHGKHVIDGVTLPKFSSANIPKREKVPTDRSYSGTSKDYLLYVGGPVWGLDWCPRAHQTSDHNVNCEYLAVAAHSPASSYHKIGVPLTGRGVVQIWCLLNVTTKEEEPPNGKKQRKPTKQIIQKDSIGSVGGDKQVILVIESDGPMKEEEPPSLKKQRGRPRKQLIQKDPLGAVDSDKQVILVVESENPGKDEEPPSLKKQRGRPKKQLMQKEPIVSVGSDKHVVVCTKSDSVKGSISLPLKETRGRPQNPIKASFDNSNREDHFNEAPAGGNVVETDSISLKTPRGRPRNAPKKGSRGRPGKRNDIKEVPDDLTRDGQFVPLSIEFPKELSALNVAGATCNTEKQCSNDAGHVIEKYSTVFKKSRGRPRKTPLSKSLGRPTNKKDTKKDSDNIDRDINFVGPLAVEFPKESPALLDVNGVTSNTDQHPLLAICETDAGLGTETQCNSDVLTCRSSLVAPAKKRKLKDQARDGSYIDVISPLLLAGNELNKSCANMKQGSTTCGQDATASSKKVENDGSVEIITGSSHPPEEVSLPRVVLSIAHNGRVAWDMKWRPFIVEDLEQKHHMGYLAVLLGNGSLEVWEVPSLSTIKLLYSSCKKDGTDPRFVKLEPIFRCSKLNFGDKQSIPLTVEWSSASPHDLIVAGCHDGTVALWKFSASGSCKDTRPLLCFSADTVPIRALAWAPYESDLETGNVIVTAGHGGLRFWDIRDPYRPLWDLNPMRRNVYGLDWLSDPRCLIISLDDGTLRILSLSKSAYDVPVRGRPFVGTQHQGLHSYLCSSFPIWSVQASRLTGQVAYCSADGSVLRFQLTKKAVDKDPARNRAPHFLCGSLTEEDATLTVNTPLQNIPFPMKKSLNECGDTPRTMRGFLTDSNKVKRANDQKLDEQILALCYGDDPGSEDIVAARKGKTTQKSSKKDKPDQYLACSEPEDSECLEKGEDKDQQRTEVEVLPPKMVAMHRVRWNMNKGSERLLCYGGAAGIVRCQELPLSAIGVQSSVER